MVTGGQIRAARALLRWSAEQTAELARVTRKTIERLEQFDGIPPSRSQTLVELQRIFETAGIEFIGTPEDGPGVRLRRKLGRESNDPSGERVGTNA
jgi:transcriptional regulator with XRE-family HTH domain